LSPNKVITRDEISLNRNQKRKINQLEDLQSSDQSKSSKESHLLVDKEILQKLRTDEIPAQTRSTVLSRPGAVSYHTM
jgi:hypothetical protein